MKQRRRVLCVGMLVLGAAVSVSILGVVSSSVPVTTVAPEVLRPALGASRKHPVSRTPEMTPSAIALQEGFARAVSQADVACGASIPTATACWDTRCAILHGHLRWAGGRFAVTDLWLRPRMAFERAVRVEIPAIAGGLSCARAERTILGIDQPVFAAGSDLGLACAVYELGDDYGGFTPNDEVGGALCEALWERAR
jgi:hypothetical protein